MKYIFVAGAPGSKWSSVVKNIYWSASLDHSDYSEQRVYYHDATGEYQLMHLGAYWDPGMEFGANFDQIDLHDRASLEVEFDRPFAGSGPRIIKSHSFCWHVGFLKHTWPDCKIVLVHRDNDACLGWWVRCGEFGITYPDYAWYQNLRCMSTKIDSQNQALQHWIDTYRATPVATNQELAQLLSIDQPPLQYNQNYAKNDIRVFVI